MNLPRWTVYPALGVVATLIVMAVPKATGEDPYEGATPGAGAGSKEARGESEHKEVVVLGIDGMDPDILAEVMERFPDRMPNFRWLIDSADGIHSLGTSTPPQSPVAWSNFITGTDPGAHGIFDFIHRDPMTRGVASSTFYDDIPDPLKLPGPWIVPLPGESGSNRTGESFWSILAEHGVPADIWRMPANFPVEPSKGLSFPGMMTPALDSAYGQCSFFTTDPIRDTELSRYDKAVLVSEIRGKIRGRIQGPGSPYTDYAELEKPAAEYAEFTAYVDRENEAAAIVVGTEKLVMRPGQWSDFIRVEFDAAPMGAMTVSGVCRLYLRSIDPEFELYVSAINLDPENPIAPVSEPSDASADLAEGLGGAYYTQGMAEDVNALKNGVLNDAEFMQQAELVYVERRKMMDYALDRYVEDGEGGLLFFYFSTVDLCSHMMWRHYDGAHPHHDPDLASESSEDWSGREGSTWKDTVHDLYLRMDPVLGTIRERLGDDVTLIVMSDHGFAPYRREFSLNTWLVEEGYLKLHDGKEPEQKAVPLKSERVYISMPGVVDWSQTKAYGMGFNGLYMNLAGRELDNPKTDEDESGIVDPKQKLALLREIKAKLEAYVDEETGMKPILRCDIAEEIYHGDRVDEAPDMLVGFNAGYGNADSASLGRIPHVVLQDNIPDNNNGSFNGSHLMAPEVVAGILISNKPIREGEHKLEDLTVEVLRQYGIDKTGAMRGHPVLEE